MQIDSTVKIDYSGKELFELKYFLVGEDGSDPQRDDSEAKDDKDVFVQVSRSFSKKQMETIKDQQGSSK